MQYTRSAALFTIAAFLLGFGLGGASMHYASAEGLFGVTASVKQLGSAWADMQKNVDELEKKMGTIKHAKEQLAALTPESGGDAMKKEGKSFNKTSTDLRPCFRAACKDHRDGRYESLFTAE